MDPIILIRGTTQDNLQEFRTANRFFSTSTSRMKIPRDSLVIGRYSVLPFYKEVEDDLAISGSVLINSYQQHRYIADMINWYSDLKRFTPTTWFNIPSLPEEGPFIVKGETNSRKFQWNTHMFANNKYEASEIAWELSNDSLIGHQRIYARMYVPLVTYCRGINGLPITKEFRFFVCCGKVLSGAFYWSSHVDEIKDSFGKIPDYREVPEDFLKKIIDSIGKSAVFYTLDVAQTVSGNWILIEVNDGQMSGLSENDPEELYSNLKIAIKNFGREYGI